MSISQKSPSAIMNIFFTSGTTGKPKGVTLSHAAISNDITVWDIFPERG